MDEAGSTTQSPFIMAPDLRESDPEVDGNGAVVDNSSMSSSRTRSGSSRSGSTGASGSGGASRSQPTPRADANGTTAKDDAKSEGTTDPASEADQSAPIARDQAIVYADSCAACGSDSESCAACGSDACRRSRGPGAVWPSPSVLAVAVGSSSSPSSPSSSLTLSSHLIVLTVGAAGFAVLNVVGLLAAARLHGAPGEHKAPGEHNDADARAAELLALGLVERAGDCRSGWSGRLRCQRGGRADRDRHPERAVGFRLLFDRHRGGRAG